MNHMKLRTLLICGFGVVLTLLLVVGSIPLISFARLDGEISTIATRRLPNLSAYAALETQVHIFRGQSLSAYAFPTPSAKATTSLKELLKERADTWAEVDRLTKTLDELPRTDSQIIQMHEKMSEDLVAVRQGYANMESALAELVSASSAGDTARYTQVFSGLDETINAISPISAELRTLISNIIQRQTHLAEGSAKAAVENAEQSSKVNIALMSIGLVLGIVAGFVIFRAVIRQIGGEPGYIQSVMQRVSDADLSVKPKLRPDDTSSVLYGISVTINKLREIIDTISRNANDIAAASEQLSATSTNIATASETQSQAATSMAASVEEMTVSINHVSASATDADKMAQQSGNSAREGEKTITSVVADINRVARDIADAAHGVEELGTQSREIASVVNIIKEVADQTNLLALNAAIEAARAGEQGRGFAVVADEVRKLAERTAASTEDIARIVTQINTGTERAVQTMRQQSEGVKSTVELSERASTNIGQITEASTALLNVVSEISRALSEQSTASTEIAKNVERIASMSEDNTVAVSEVATATRDLTTRALQLQEIVNKFRL
jgi:methyl-accepting chemotaxis protein